MTAPAPTPPTARPAFSRVYPSLCFFEAAAFSASVAQMWEGQSWPAVDTSPAPIAIMMTPAATAAPPTPARTHGAAPADPEDSVSDVGAGGGGCASEAVGSVCGADGVGEGRTAGAGVAGVAAGDGGGTGGLDDAAGGAWSRPSWSRRFRIRCSTTS